MIYKIFMMVILVTIALYNLATVIFGARSRGERYPRLKGLIALTVCIFFMCAVWQQD